MANPVVALGAFVGGSLGGAASNVLTDLVNGTINTTFPHKMPDLGFVMEAYLQGTVHPEVFEKAARYQGFDYNLGKEGFFELVDKKANGQWFFNPQYATAYTGMEHMLISQTWSPTIDESLRLYQREFIDYKLLRHFMQRNRIKDEAQVQLMIDQTKEIPGPSDLVRFAVRDCFTPEIVEKFGYHLETPYDIMPWMRKQGLGYDLPITKPVGTKSNGRLDGPRPAQWFDFFWWSHWELPSLTQGYTMFFQLYPESQYGPSPRGSASTWFTGPDLELLQKANDIPEYWRKRLQAISYLPLTRVDVRRMYNLNLIDDAAVYHAYRHNGYNDENAKNLLAFAKFEKARSGMDARNKIKEAKICGLYKKGVIFREQALELYSQLGYTVEQALFALDQCELGLKEELVTTHLKYIQRAFMLGKISIDGARASLLEIGIARPRVDHYIALWEMKFRFTSKEITVKKMEEWYNLGILQEDEMFARLVNLGYSREDAGRIIRAIKTKSLIKITEIQRRQLEQAVKDNQKLAEKVAKAKAKSAEKAAAKAKSLAGFGTLAQYRKWYLLGEMSLREIADRLRAKDWPEVDVRRFLIELVALSKKGGKKDGTPEAP